MGSSLNPEYWNNRYLNQEIAWDLGAISTPLQMYFDQLNDPEIFILIPGAGNAYEAEYLFSRGFKNVFICDIAQEPLQNFSNRCPDFNKNQLLLLDFFKLKNISFDLIVEQTFFCALHPSLRQKYFDKAAELLKPGGKIVGVLFDDPLNDDKPPFGGNKKEYLTYIKPPLRIKIFESCYNSIKPRAGRELFINLVKVNHGDTESTEIH